MARATLRNPPILRGQWWHWVGLIGFALGGVRIRKLLKMIIIGEGVTFKLGEKFDQGQLITFLVEGMKSKAKWFIKLLPSCKALYSFPLLPLVSCALWLLLALNSSWWWILLVVERMSWSGERCPHLTCDLFTLLLNSFCVSLVIHHLLELSVNYNSKLLHRHLGVAWHFNVH